MGTRTPVFLYAGDPVSAAGAKAQLIFEPSIELVGPMDVDRARVALVIADAVDASLAKVAKAIQRDGIPHVVVVASRFEEGGVVEAVAAGVVGFLRRNEATCARLVELITGADRSVSLLPEGLLKRASVQFHPTAGPQAVVDMRRPVAEPGPVATVSDLRLSAREVEILRLVAEGYDTTEVAEQLAYSESTIKGVLAKAMVKLDARNRCQAVAVAVRLGLI
jgi:DNA-binding NarL/FixJ family response regulator